MRRRIHTFLAAVVVLCAVSTVIPPAPVSAHASVVATTPAANAVLRTAPASVSVQFNEPVGASASKVQLLDRRGGVVPTRFTMVDTDRQAQLRPVKRLAAGGYVLRWSVVSEDGHVVAGASTFWVGTPPPAGAPVRVALSAGSVRSSARFSSDRAGVATVALPPGTTAVEFRHRLVGAALQITAPPSGSMQVLLPLTGVWNMTVLVRESEFAEKRYLGTFTAR